PIVNGAGAEVPMGELAAEGTNVNVAVVNNKQNQQEYVSPFGVERRDRVTEREQSLSLEFQNFAEDYEFRAFRTFPETRDYTQYKTIAFYLNPKLEDLGASPDSVEFFLRFGTNGASDTLSYYEVSTRLTTDDPRLREDGWLDFRINVADLSAAKTVRPTVGIGPGDFVAGPFDADTTVIANGDTTQFYARRDIGDGLNLSVRGLPSFNQIRRLSVGVRNVSGKKIPDGRVWFNEIRMGDVRRDTGWVGRAAGTLTLADVAVVNGGLTVSNEDFVRLGEERGSGARDVNYNYGATVNLHKFVEETGFNAPLKYTTRRSKKTPKFFANSDIEFSGENTGRDITETGQDDLSISISRTPRGRGSFLTRYSIDAMRFSALSSKSFNNGVTQVDTTERRNTNLSYSLSLNPRAFKLFPGLELRPTPRQLGVTWSRSKTERASYTRDSLDPTKLNLTQNRPTESGELSLNTSFNPITNVTYSFNAKRDLIDENFSLPLVRDNRPPRSFLGLNIGRETSQGQNISANYTPPFGGIFSPRLTANSAYAQDFSPNATREGYSAPAKNVNNSSNVSLNGRIPIGRLIAKLFPPPTPEGQSISASKDIQERRQRQDAHIERMLEKERERKRAAGVIDSTQVATPDSSVAPGELEREGGIDPEEEKKEPKSSRNRLHSFFTNVIKLSDIQGSGSVRRSSSYSLIDGSPGLAYRFGLTQDVGLDDQVNRIFETLSDETLAPRTNSNFGKTNQLRASTQATAFKKIQMDFNFQHSVDERNSNTTNTVTKNTVWPEIKFNWGDIHKSLPIIKSLFSEFRAVSSSFRKETRKQGTA
ncbi:MAG: hypothetical protein HKN21_08350, partial [Candidatus Eisenbacteria bacterium]|nr:hypothetical protein [Candidatus Eisenbacteria bacterium]